MVATNRLDTDRYNELGKYVLRERGNRSLAQIAQAGGISEVRLGRWLRAELSRVPPTDVLQAIADGLHRPLIVVQTMAMRAAGQATPNLLSDEQQTVVAAMAEISETWQRVIVDLALRVVEEVRHVEGPLAEADA